MKLPKATHMGELNLAGTRIPCAVLEDGTRLLTQQGFLKTLSRARAAKGGQGASVAKTPAFMAANNLKPFISKDLAESTRPVRFRGIKGTLGYGYKAEILPQVCQVYLEARDAGALHPRQEHIARKAEILVRALAQVGIIALIDEATGYQYDRDRYELHKILDAYIAKELLPWAKRFPDEYYQELFRLRNWRYSPLSVARPQYVGKLTNELIYNRLPPGIRAELQKKNPTNEKKRRRHKHHQFLTYDIGIPHLNQLLAGTVALMRASPNWQTFKRLFARAYPKTGEQIPLAIDQVDTD